MVELVSSYSEMREGGFQIVDKTLLARDLIRYKGVSSLYLRPRRFGKSLAVSMLDSFFNMDFKGNDWFDGTEIMDCPEMAEHMNSHPVINLDLKDLSGESFDEVFEKLSSKMAEISRSFPDLLESSVLCREDIDDLVKLRNGTGSRAQLSFSVYFLSRIIHQHYGVRPILLIDEYDAVLNSTCNEEWHGRVLTLMKGFLSPALKSNRHILFAFVTGVTDIGRESIFSGLNNMYVNDITSDDRPERFGFTEDEVRGWCRLKALDSSMDEEEIFREIAAWYDGYTFGDTRVFNPWSVVNYLGRMKARPYWVNSGSLDVIRDILMTNMDALHGTLNKLASCEPVISTMRPWMTFSSLNGSPSSILSFLAMSGYLTIRGEWSETEFRIPNREVRDMFEEILNECSGISEPKIRMKALAKAFRDADLEMLPSRLEDVIMDFFTGYRPRTEEAYQVMLTACAFNLESDFEVKTEVPAGKGRADVWIRRIKGTGPNIVMELKRVKDGEDPSEIAKDALVQVMEKRYVRGLNGRTLVYGIALGGERPVLEFDSLEYST